ncbi:DsbA family protein [Nonomuraea sp. NPDC050404]|uniref:DsbA family protein n=1 Tax=Nonomuraea sp. NPDC050404 TaxID=3155783 RepID=UPI0033EB68EB
MQVEIWSEVACPWCGLGSHCLERAVERFEYGERVEVVHRSFPLGSRSSMTPARRSAWARAAPRSSSSTAGTASPARRTATVCCSSCAKPGRRPTPSPSPPAAAPSPPPQLPDPTPHGK